MRILALHGYQTSSNIFMIQSRFLLNKLNKTCEIEWIIPDGIHLSKEPILPIIKKYFNSPYYHWYTSKNNKFIGIEDSIEYLKTFENIDGIIGFSQGACLAQILSNIIKPKFIISVCGVNCLDNRFNFISETPSLHIIGEKDNLKNRSLLLADNFKNPIILYDKKGEHNFPVNKNIYIEIENFIVQFNI